MATFIRYEEVENTPNGIRPISRYVNVAHVETASCDADTGELILRFASSSDKGSPRFAVLTGKEAETARAVLDTLIA